MLNKNHNTYFWSFNQEKLIAKIIKGIIKVTATFLIILIIAISLLLLRLSFGPIGLNFLTPALTRTLSNKDLQLQTKIQQTLLVWDKWYSPFEVRLTNVDISHPSKKQLLLIEHIGLSLSFPSLLKGKIFPSHIKFYHPSLSLKHESNNAFSLNTGDQDQTIDPELLIGFLLSRKELGPFSKYDALKKISIIDGHFSLYDMVTKKNWNLPHITLKISRKTNRLKGKLLFLQSSGEVSIDLRDNRISSTLDCTLSWDGINLSQLIDDNQMSFLTSQDEKNSLEATLSFLRILGTPAEGTLRFKYFPQTGRINDGILSLNLKSGHIKFSNESLLPITAGNIEAHLLPGHLEIKNFSFLSDETLIQGTASLKSTQELFNLKQPLPPYASFSASIKIKDFELHNLKHFWPETAAPTARTWLVQNLQIGKMKNASVTLKGNMDEMGNLHINTWQGNFLIKSALLHYFGELPPLQNLGMYVTFDPKGFDIHVLKGKVHHLDLEEGRVFIKGLDEEETTLSIQLNTKGDLGNLLYILNQNPLNYADKAKIIPENVQGNGLFKLAMYFPLVKDIKLKDITLSAEGKFNDTTLKRKMTDSLTTTLEKGDVDIQVTQDSLNIKSVGVVNQIPAQLSYNQHFSQERHPAWESQLILQAIPTEKDFQRLGFDFSTYSNGPIKTALKYTREWNKDPFLLFDLDFLSSHITFPYLGWIKSEKQPCKIKIKLVFPQSNPLFVENFQIHSEYLQAQGNVFFDTQQNWQKITTDLKYPSHDTKLYIERKGKSSYFIDIQGQEANIEKFLTFLEENNESNHSDQQFYITASLKSLKLGEERIFKQVEANAALFMSNNSSYWHHLKLTAQAGKGMLNKGDNAQAIGGLLFEISPPVNNQQTLLIRASDAGQALKVLGINGDIKSGQLTVKAYRENTNDFKGSLKLKEFRVKRVPLIARLVALASPIGLYNLFSSGETLSLDRFDCHFTFGHDKIFLQDGLGKSMSLGFTTQGIIDRKNKLLDLKGTIIPAYVLNSFLSNIPILGNIITGGEGHGLLAITYKIMGPYETAKIDLSPLSSLAPGFLRNFLDSSDSEDSTP